MALIISGCGNDETDPATIKSTIRFLRFAFIFLVVGVGIILFWTVERFVCERSKNICEFQGRHIWQMDYEIKDQVALSSIDHAYLVENRSKDSTTYQVMLQLAGMRRPLFNVYSSGYGTHSAHVDQINNYLKSSEEKLEIQEDFLIFIISALFILVGSVFCIYLPFCLKKRLAELAKNKPIFPSRDS